MHFFLAFFSFSVQFLLIPSHGNPVRTFLWVIIYYVAGVITTLMSISDRLDQYFFRQRMEKTRSMKEEMMDGEVFIFRPSQHFSFIDNKIKVLFFICILNWRVGNYISCEKILQIGETKILVILYKIVAFGTVLLFSKNMNRLLWLKLFPHKNRR